MGPVLDAPRSDGRRAGERRAIPAAPTLARLLGPAFVACVAYVDPGNVAANLTAGSRYGYLLLWVLVAANAIAVLVQYLSAKLGLVTGSSLPALIGGRLGRRSRLAFWVQAEFVALATDLAEVVGGALALKLLFGLPLVVGGVVITLVSLGILALQSRPSQRLFQSVVIGLLAVLSLGFCAGLFFAPPDAGGMLAGLAPRFEGTGSVLLAVSMLGATVMPHAIYLHSSLARDRYRGHVDARSLARMLRATRLDVVLALVLAGGVNIAMLLLAASTLGGVKGTDTIAGAHAAIVATLGAGIGVLFAVGLLASGLASSAVGSYAGSEIMAGLLHLRVPVMLRRVLTAIPALVVLALGVAPTTALVVSQVVLSFGIPFALVPLVRLTSDRALMGEGVNRRFLAMLAWLAVTVIVVLNLVLIALTIAV